MRHAGVCVPRQYAVFAGIVQGQKTRRFFAKLVQRGYACEARCRRNRGRVYHVHHHALYRAIGAPHSRYRRPVSARCAAARFMMLDALLAARDVTWFATPEEVRVHLASPLSNATGEASAHVVFRDATAARLCGDTTRLGVDANGRTVLLQLVERTNGEVCDRLVQRRAA